MKRKTAFIVTGIMLVLVSVYSIKSIKPLKFLPNKVNIESANPSKAPTSIPTSTVIPTPSLTPTPKPLTFSQTNAMYGPCVKLPVLMYHHVQSKENANLANQTALTVYTDVFTSQVQYLKSKGYVAIGPEALISFFDAGAPL